MKRCTIAGLFLFVFSVIGIQAQTSFTDDFEAGTMGTGWKTNAAYYLSQAGGILTVNARTTQPNQKFTLTLSDTIDISTNPIVNLKLKGSVPYMIRVKLIDAIGLGGKDSVMARLPVITPLFTNYCFDFSTKTGVNKTKVLKIEFFLNPNANGFGGTAYFDDLQVGTTATKFANISPASDITVYQNTKNHKIVFTDITNASGLSKTGADPIINNVAFSAINTSLVGGISNMTFDCIDGAAGAGIVIVTAAGTGGFASNTSSFTITVEGNKVPTIDVPANAKIATGKVQAIKLTGISDGNASIEQPLTITASSDAVGIIPDPTVTYTQGSPYATLNVNPASAGTANITVTVKDTGSVNHTTTVIFAIEAFDGYNNAPTINSVINQSMYLSEGTSVIKLSGISDGDPATQVLTLTATGKHAAVISSAVISNAGLDTAILTLTAAGLGKDTITVKVDDDGDNGTNNGDQSTQIIFTIEVLKPAQTGYKISMLDFTADTAAKLWRIEGLNVSQFVKYVDTLGKRCLRIQIVNKTNWTAVWWEFNNMPLELDITGVPYISYEIFGKGFTPLMTHAYFWDVDGFRNSAGSTAERDTITTPDTGFTKVFFDFRKPGYLDNGTGKDINTQRIIQLLFNYHNKFAWPNNTVSGTVYISDIRVGDSCKNVPPVTPLCTINPMPIITHWAGAGTYTVDLTGVSNGNGNVTGVVITPLSSKVPFIPAPSLGTIGADGKVTVTYTLQTANIDSAALIFRVNCPGSIQKEMRFMVKTVSDKVTDAVAINIDGATLGQTIQGFGAMNPSEIQLEQLADQGCTMMRYTVDWDFEMANDNTNPYALDRSKINPAAINFDYLKRAYNLGIKDIFITLWSPPAWMKLNLSGVSGADISNPATSLNKVDPMYYDEYVEYMVAMIKLIKEETGIELVGFCPQNEPMFNEPYGSAILDPTPFATVCGLFGKRLADEGFATKVINSEQVFGQGNGTVEQNINALRANPLANEFTKVVGMHYPDDNPLRWNSQWNLCKATPYPKEYWGTECTTEGDDIAGALYQAQTMLTGFNYGLSAWIVWGYTNGMIRVKDPLKHYWVYKNFAKYIRKGAVQMKSTSSNAKVSVGAFKNDADTTITIVLLNKDSQLPFGVRLTGSVPAEGWDAYRSSLYEKFEKVTPFKNGVIALPPKSITTLVIKTNINHAPTVDPPVDVKLAVNSGTGTTLNGIGCGDPTAQAITITATSSNTSVLPNPTVNYTSPANKATLLLVPVTDAKGETTITVIIKDDGGRANGGIDADTVTFKVSIGMDALNDISDKVSLYPNPADDRITLTLPAELSNAGIIVSNAAGQIVKEQKLEGQNQVDMNVSDLPAGAYFINISGNSNAARLRFSKK